MLSKALEMGICFHRDPVLGNMGGEISFFFIRRTFIEEFERHVKEGAGNGKLVHRDPVLGNMGGRPFPTAFERGEIFIYSGKFL